MARGGVGDRTEETFWGALKSSLEKAGKRGRRWRECDGRQAKDRRREVSQRLSWQRERPTTALVTLTIAHWGTWGAALASSGQLPGPALRGPQIPPFSGFSPGSSGGPGSRCFRLCQVRGLGSWSAGAGADAGGGEAIAWGVSPGAELVCPIPLLLPSPPRSFPSAGAFPPVPLLLLSSSHFASGPNSPGSWAFSSPPPQPVPSSKPTFVFPNGPQLVVLRLLRA